ncbi:GAF domain-containing protein [Oculatella sp. LEGE 06141]|uniref:GAF domain-containing protein n=1 Tax=Oculatella sp. LEGE 06141 TaxID=1828648 RepID=UPI00188288F8|nr:GAF domain-containing protein [Oculatella sp. LEGE 06141]MBE9179429.1 GAF domain-containing protein [Oculatella sp. LEGE 06141]
MTDYTFPQSSSRPALPAELESIFETHQTPDAVFTNLMPTLGQVLNCDRCFLYLRNPRTQVGKVVYCWRRKADYRDVTDPEWKPEPEHLSQDDPLFAAALRAEPSVYVNDIETASPEVVNVEFEKKYLHHRALVHAHICQDNLLWGILQPCMMEQPREWDETDRAIIFNVVQKMTPLAIAYIKSAGI